MIVIVNFGAGNIKSIENALYDLNVDFCVSDDKNMIKKAEKIIFPGVGSAQEAMKALTRKNLKSTLQSTKKPFLGICLGMQLLTEFSEEGKTDCLGIIPTSVCKFDNSSVKVPHMGWNSVNYITENPLFNKISNYKNFYFANSYYVPKNDFTIAVTSYGNVFSAVVQKENFYGVQFHPEKSGKAGLQILKNFIELC